MRDPTGIVFFYNEAYVWLCLVWYGNLAFTSRSLFRCQCEQCNDQNLVGALEFRCYREVVVNASVKMCFDGSIERISCIYTQHKENTALTNITVLLQVAPLLRGNRRPKRKRVVQIYRDFVLAIIIFICLSKLQLLFAKQYIISPLFVWFCNLRLPQALSYGVLKTWQLSQHCLHNFLHMSVKLFAEFQK